ncbi:hypothetical protein [Klebsiella quasipneumoniae]|uniref:hypothetical protein n=1 Tax=Klebsiella quasipneumoniae TaxID=1463165 RepID=UPI00294A0D9E|nr:hypothetical protein [Klebsiella quasipneumoniae]MDV5433156.1 hypothetical protein [Klebsiella quasipneumoniae]
MHNYTTYEEHVRYVELPQHEHENHHHDKEGTASDVLEPKKKEKAATGNEKSASITCFRWPRNYLS